MVASLPSHPSGADSAAGLAAIKQQCTVPALHGVQNYSVVALAVASDHKLLAPSNKREPPAAGKPVLASPRASGTSPLTSGVWHLLRVTNPPGSPPTGRAPTGVPHRPLAKHSKLGRSLEIAGEKGTGNRRGWERLEEAAANNCLARSNKSRTRAETTKKRRRQRDAIPLAARCGGQRCRSLASSPAEYARVRWNSSQAPQSGRFPDAVPVLPLLSCDDAPVAHRAQAERGERRHAFLRVRPLRLRYFGRRPAI